jgi:hypothetical protein
MLAHATLAFAANQCNLSLRCRILRAQNLYATMATALRFGVIFALMQFVWLIGEYLVGLHTTYINLHSLYTNLILVPSVAIMIWGLFARKAELGGDLTYVQALGQGLGVGATVGILSVGIQYLFFTYINPNFFADFIRYAVDNQLATLDAAEAYFNFINYAIQAAVFAPVAGLATNAIAGLFLKTSWR